LRRSQKCISELFQATERQEEWSLKARGLFIISGKLKPVTAASVRALLNFKYSDGIERMHEMETGQGFLTFLQATKCNGQVKTTAILVYLIGNDITPTASSR
jgi:hypothetical protein